VLLRASGPEHFFLRSKRFARASTAMAVIVPGGFVSVATVAVEPTAVCECYRRDRDIAQHQQYRTADKDGNEDRASMHWFT